MSNSGEIHLSTITAEEAIGNASKIFGCEPEYVWSSENAEDWAGPSAGWASWPG